MRETLVESARPDGVKAELRDTDTHIHYLRSLVRPPAGSRAVPQDVFWLVDGTTYLGEIRIRRRASGSHPSIKSHLYYEIRPSRRGRGLGIEMLRRGLLKARALGHRRLLASAQESNQPSRRMLEQLGARLIARRTIPHTGGTFRLYEIRLAARRTA
ncbi:MAG: GNAT family N-acetyltransferase [Deltaproteobacteria bacterium]|nr:GNAT family N-acetyltransferase [Deltaproteobacteria bacterium]